jgi:hypothetical protein
VVALRELEVLRYVSYLYLEGTQKVKVSASVKVKAKRQPIYLEIRPEICRRIASFTGDSTFLGEPVMNRRKLQDSPHIASTANPNVWIPKYLNAWVFAGNIFLHMLLAQLRTPVVGVQDASNLGY